MEQKKDVRFTVVEKYIKAIERRAGLNIFNNVEEMDFITRKLVFLLLLYVLDYNPSESLDCFLLGHLKNSFQKTFDDYLTKKYMKNQDITF